MRNYYWTSCWRKICSRIPDLWDKEGW